MRRRSTAAAPARKTEHPTQLGRLRIQARQRLGTRMIRATIAQTRCPERLTASAASACLHCAMGMSQATMTELVTRARLLVPVLRQRAPEAEKLRRLPDATIADLQESELFRLFQPARYGGIEAPFRAFIDIGGALGRGCGSTSWVFNNLVVHNWMLGYWPPAMQDEVWQADPHALIGSSFVFPAGHAEKAPGGYRLSGKWPFSSGIDASEWMMLAAPVASSDGKAPEPRFFIVPKSDYRAVDNWYAMGLAGTGSKDVTTDNIFVPTHRTLAASDGKGGPHPGSKVNPGALYKLP